MKIDAPSPTPLKVAALVLLAALGIVGVVAFGVMFPLTVAGCTAFAVFIAVAVFVETPPRTALPAVVQDFERPRPATARFATNAELIAAGLICED